MSERGLSPSRFFAPLVVAVALLLVVIGLGTVGHLSGGTLLGIVLALGVGLAAGYWPARNASNLAVVDALRDE